MSKFNEFSTSAVVATSGCPVPVKLLIDSFSKLEYNLVDGDGNVLDDHYYTFVDGFENGSVFYKEGDQLIPVEFKEQSGGGEGGAEDCEAVLKIGEQYFMVNYSYYSHHGYEFDYASVREVTPKLVQVTKYVSV